MIQDIFPHHYDNTYHPEKHPSPESVAICRRDSQILVRRLSEGEQFDFPRFRELWETDKSIDQNSIYLFSVDETKFYLTEDCPSEIPASFSMESPQFFRGAMPGHLAFAGITACQLAGWYQSHRYCGCCGAPLKKHEKERMLYCENCHQMEYPRISPAVIIGVTDGNRLLLSKYAGRTYKRYALLAGFAEIGETLEETVKREVMEEVGLKVTNIRYYKSQPWSFTDTLLVGFFCDLAEPGEIRLEQEELAMAAWFEREEIPNDGENGLSLTHEMIQYFREGKLL